MDESGLLSLTQRLAAAHCSDQVNKRNDAPNPFGLQKPLDSSQRIGMLTIFNLYFFKLLFF